VRTLNNISDRLEGLSDESKIIALKAENERLETMLIEAKTELSSIDFHVETIRKTLDLLEIEDIPF
jgi:hypothetical protein